MITIDNLWASRPYRAPPPIPPPPRQTNEGGIIFSHRCIVLPKFLLKKCGFYRRY